MTHSWRSVATFGIVLLLASLVMIRPDFPVSWDLSEYIATATSFLKGQSFMDADGDLQLARPVFRILIVAGLALDDGLAGVAGFVFAFAVLLVLSVYWLVQRLWDTETALAAVLVVFSTPMILWAAPRHLDALWPALLFLATAVWLPGAHKDSSNPSRQALWSSAAGVLFALSVGVKEFAILFAPVWLIAFLFRPRLHELRALSIFYAIAIVGIGLLVVLPRAFVVNPETAHNPIIYLHWLERYGGDGVFGRLFGLATFVFDGLIKFFVGGELRNGFFAHQHLSVFMPITLIYLVATAFRKIGSVVIIAFIICSVPILVITGAWDLRYGQVMIFEVAWRIGCAAMIVDVLRWVMRRIPSIKYPGQFAVLIAFAALVAGAQWALDDPRGRRTRGTLAGQIANGQPFWQVSERGQSLASFPDELGINQSLMVSFIPARNGIYRKLDAQVRVHLLPLRYLSLTRGHPDFPELREPGTAPFSAQVSTFHPKSYLSNYLFILDLKEWSSEIRKHSVQYVILNNRRDSAIIIGLSEGGVEPIFRKQDKRESYAIYRAADIAQLAKGSLHRALYADEPTRRWLDRLAQDQSPGARTILELLKPLGAYELSPVQAAAPPTNSPQRTNR